MAAISGSGGSSGTRRKRKPSGGGNHRPYGGGHKAPSGNVKVRVKRRQKAINRAARQATQTPQFRKARRKSVATPSGLSPAQVTRTQQQAGTVIPQLHVPRVATGIGPKFAMGKGGQPHDSTKTWRSGQIPEGAKIAADVALSLAPLPGAEELGLGRLAARVAEHVPQILKGGERAATAERAASAAKEVEHLPRPSPAAAEKDAAKAAEVARGPKVRPKAEAKPEPKVSLRERARNYREQRVPLKERPGKVGKVVRQRRKVAAAAAIAPVAVDPAKGIHGQGPGFAAIQAAGGAVQSALPGPIGNAARDVVEFPAQTIPTAYAIGHAGVKAAEGNTSEAKALLDAYKQHGFLPKVVSGDISGAAQTFEQHPVFSGLEVAGAYSGVGRALGAAARHSGVEALREAASTKRAPAHVAGGIEIHREYSKNPATKAAQVAVERRTKSVSPTKATRYIKKRLNYHTGKGHARGRDVRDQALRAMTKAHPKRGPRLDKQAGDVVSFVAQRAIRSPKTWQADIAKLIDGYTKARKSGELTKPEIEAVSHNLHVLREAENLSPQRIAATFRSAEHYVKQERPLRATMERQGHYAQGQTERAALFPYARLHMGAKYDVAHETRNEIAAQQLDRIARKVETGVTPSKDELAIASASGDSAKALRARADELRGEHANPPPTNHDTRELVDQNGHRLSTAAIKAHMARNGVAEPGFVPHRPNPRNAFYAASAERPQVPRGARSGEAFMRGTFDASYQGLAEHLLRSHSIANATDIFDQVGVQFGARSRGTKAPIYFKSAQDVRLATGDPERFHLDLAPGERYVPFRVTSAFPKEAEIRAVHDLTPEEDVVLGDLESRLSGTGKGRYVAIPASVASLLRQHYRVPTKFEKAMQVGTGQFKATVLPTSPSFFTGNAVDNYIVRPAVANVGPLSYLLGRRILAKLDAHDPVLARDVRTQFLRGTFYGSAKTERVFRSAAKDFDSRAASIVADLLRAPGVKTVRRAWNAYRSGVLSLNARMESQPQIAGFGKLARKEIRDAGHSWADTLRLQENVVLDLTKRLKNPDREVKFAQAMWDMWGKWDDWSPSTRYFLQTYSPFGSWLYNASRLALWTLPTKHPVKAGLIAAMENATAGQREQQGQSLFAKKPLPGYVQGGIPWGPGGKGILGVSHFTSFGIFDDPAQTVSGSVLPQFSSGLKALIGVKWTGQQLVDAQGRPLSLEQRFLVAANATVEGFVPLTQWLRRVREHGGPSADTSTIINPQAKKEPKKYQKGGGALDLLNPFTYYDPSYIKYLREPKKTVTYPANSTSSGTSSPFSGSSGFSSSFGGTPFK